MIKRGNKKGQSPIIFQKKNSKGQSPIIFQKKNSKGQFYLIATIIIVGLLIGLSVVFNYSTKASSYGIEKITKELIIESEKVLDYDTIHSTDEFEDFSKEYSAYVGEDKEIYFIIVDGSSEEAYKYTEGTKVDLSDDLNVEGSVIRFALDNRIYNFKLEEGKNFYFIIVYDKGGERYVYTG